MTRRARWLLLLASGLSGCALITHPAPHHGFAANLTSSPAGSPGLATKYTDFVGVMHLHTREYSHDAHGRFADVVRVANAQALDFVVLTEHNTLQHLRDGREGWYGRTLVLAGTEISTDQGHYVALNVHEEIDRTKFHAQQIIEEVNRQGGLGFIAHPYFKNGRWRDWTVHGFTGIEAYNAAHDTLDENKARLALWTLFAPIEPFYESILNRPYDPLASWDEMIRRHGRIVGIGAMDAHEFHALGVTFAPYDIMCQLIRNHVWVPSPTLTKESFYEALRQGHAYLAIELLAEAKGFSFRAIAQEEVVGIMGDAIPWQPGLTLDVTLPTSTTMTLFKDGEPAAQHSGTAWQVPVVEPGVYRVEVTLRGKPWIFTNPIYILPAREAPPA
jgi:hypothetical protein